MAFAQSSLHVEIQSLKDALSASEKKADRYAQLIATLSVELDNLRSVICHSCKKKLAHGTLSVSVPQITISAGQASTATAVASVSAPLWRRVFQGRQRSRPTTGTDDAPTMPLPHSLAASPSSNQPLLAPSEPENLSSSQTTTTPAYPVPNEDIIFPEQIKPVWSVVYHPDVDRALELHLAHTFMFGSDVYCIHMSPEGGRFAVGLKGGKTYLNDLQAGSNICVLVDRYVKDDINVLAIEFSPNGRFLVTGASDGQIRIWDITIKRMRAMLKGHKQPVYNVGFSPNCHSLVSASADKSIRIWNIRDGSSKILPVTGSPNYFMSVEFSPDGKYVAAGNFDGSVWIWDSRTHTLAAMWREDRSRVWCTKFTADGKGLMSGYSDDAVRYWDVSLLENRRRVDEDQSFPLVRSFLGHNNFIRSIALFPDNGQWFVTGSNDKSVRVWDMESGVCHLTLQGHMRWVRGVDVSRTQNFLATGGEDGYVSVWKYKLL